MRTIARNLTICALVTLGAAYAHMWVSGWWFRFAVEGYSGPTTIEWLDIGHLKVWVFELVWGAVIGAVVAIGVKSPRPIRWAGSCGVLAALVQFGTSRNYFYSTTPLNTYVWAYGVYVMPIVGSLVAALVVLTLKRQSPSEEMHAV